MPNTTYETLGSIIHEAHLESSLVAKSVGERKSEGVGRDDRLVARLELIEQTLESTEDACLAETSMATKLTKATAKHI